MNRSAKILAMPPAGTTQKHGSDSQITPDTHIRGNFKTVFGQGQTLEALSATILSGIKKLETAEHKAIQAQVTHNTHCCQHINAAMKQTEFLQALRATIDEDKSNPSLHYSLGIQAVLSPIQAGQPAKLSAILKQVSTEQAELSHRFLMLKVQPFLIAQGLLVKNADNTYRWPTHAELSISLPVTPNDRLGRAKAKSQQAANRATAAIKASLHQRKLKKAARDPYQRITETGEIIQLRRPYKGELTNEEKAKIRDQHKAIAEAKIAKKTELARRKTAASKERTEQRSAATQYQAINNQAELEIAEKQANRRVQQESLKSWFPLGVAAGVAALAFVSFNAAPSNAELEVSLASWEQTATEIEAAETETYPLPPEAETENEQ